jgi:hypothetical protein
MCERERDTHRERHRERQIERENYSSKNGKMKPVHEEIGAYQMLKEYFHCFLF